jgi:glutamate N-acetyltransferase/amino-acid N-acetyltransferase
MQVKSSIGQVPGFRVSGVHAGLKPDGALDMALIVSDLPCVAAGVFTTNLVKAAPVMYDMEALHAAAGEGFRAVVVNTRCANACTGDQGLLNARRMAELTAQTLNVDSQSVLVMSTGVIGMQLDMLRIEHGIHLAAGALGQDWLAAAQGIMTTDTRPKLASIQVQTPSGAVTIAGIAKGAGMIAPNMATMLAVIVTDAALNPADASALLRRSVETSFNRIVVDGDMSTNDTVLLLANGASGITLERDTDRAAFAAALHDVTQSLAKAIVRDGEGVTKFITLRVTGAETAYCAQTIANAVATSPLVKTAFYGGDPNWGRIIAAAGRAGVPFDPSRARLWITAGEDAMDDDLLLFETGTPTAYDEDRAAAIMRSPAITVHLDCALDDGEATVWTCDLSHDYVSINGHYRS